MSSFNNSSIQLTFFVPSSIFTKIHMHLKIEIIIEISLLTNQGHRRAYTNNNYDWYTTTIHQTKYSRWNINNCGAGTLGQDERQHIHIAGDSSPICKRHLESMLKGINVTQKYGVPQSDEQVWVRQSLRVVHTGSTSKLTTWTTLLGKFLSMQARVQYLSWIFIFFC